MSLPILRLRVSGYCSPITCLSAEEEEIVASAASSLQNIPVLWFRKVKHKSKVLAATSQYATVRREHQPSSCTTNCGAVPVEDEEETSFFNSNLQQHFTAFFKQKNKPSTMKMNYNKRKGVGNNNSNSNLTDATDADRDEYHGGNDEQQQQDEEEVTSTYAKFDAVLNVCDTDSGPALEVRTTSKKFSKQMEDFELVDIDKKLDTILNLSGEDSNTNECFLERIIPLDMVGHAARGGKWELENMLQVGSGDFSCGIKVYSTANDFQLIGHGKKILLFDVATDSPIDRDEAITYINALVKWNSSRLTYMSTVKDDSGDFSLQKFCC